LLDLSGASPSRPHLVSSGQRLHYVVPSYIRSFMIYCFYGPRMILSLRCPCIALNVSWRESSSAIATLSLPVPAAMLPPAFSPFYISCPFFFFIFVSVVQQKNPHVFDTAGLYGFFFLIPLTYRHLLSRPFFFFFFKGICVSDCLGCVSARFPGSQAHLAVLRTYAGFFSPRLTLNPVVVLVLSQLSLALLSHFNDGMSSHLVSFLVRLAFRPLGLSCLPNPYCNSSCGETLLFLDSCQLSRWYFAEIEASQCFSSYSACTTVLLHFPFRNEARNSSRLSCFFSDYISPSFLVPELPPLLGHGVCKLLPLNSDTVIPNPLIEFDACSSLQPDRFKGSYLVSFFFFPGL